MVSIKQYQRETTIILQPNRSASWLQTRKLMALMAVFILFIGVGWSIAGAWVILPFAGLEVGLLAFLMHRVSYNTYKKQVITVDGESIRIQSGVHYPNLTRQMAVQHTMLHVMEPDTEWDQPQLSLRSPNQVVNVGDFLNKDDKEIAAKYFKRAGIHVQSNLWWKQR